MSAESQRPTPVEPSLPDFDAFYASEFADIALIAGTTSGDRTHGEDLAQEAFSRAHAAWDDIAVLDRPGAWVRRVAINLALSRRRRLSSEVRALSRLRAHASADARDSVARAGDGSVWLAVNQLPPKQRAAIALHYYDGYSTTEIADILDCSQSAATSNLHKARTRLAKLLGDER